MDASQTERPQYGGRRPGAGRPKGSKNRPLVTLASIAGASGESALAVLEQAMKDMTQPMDVRVRAATAVLALGAGAMARSRADFGTGMTRNVAIESERFFADL